MADRTSTITIRVVDQFSKPLGDFTVKLGKAGNEVDEFGKKGGKGGALAQTSQNFFYIAQAAQKVYGAFSQVFSTANEWAKLGVSAAQSEIALRALVGAGDSYNQMITAVKTGTHGAVTEGEAAALAFSALRFNLASTPEEMQKFVDMAAKVGAASPQIDSTEEAISQISLTISNMSFMRLDQLGISAGEVRKRMAELKTEVKGISTEEAFKTAVFEQLEEQARAFGDEIIEVNDSTEVFRAKWRGFKEGLGKEIAEGFEGAAVAAVGLMDVVSDLGTTKALEVFAQGMLETFDYIVAEIMGWEQSGPKFQNVPTEEEILKMSRAELENYLFELGYAGVSPLIQETSPELFGRGYGPRGGKRQIPMAGQRKYAQLFETRAGAMFDPGAEYGMDMIGDWELGDRRNAYRRATRARQYAGLTTRASWMDEELGPAGAYYNQMQWQQKIEERQRAYGRRHVWSSMGAGMGNIYEQMQGAGGEASNQAVAGFEAVAGAISRVASAAFDLVGAGEAVGQQFDSLAEKFGINAEKIDIEIYDEMTAKLEELGVETETATAALEMYQQVTGMANASSEAFDIILGNISEQFATGKLTAEEYVTQIQRLKNTDLSNLDKLLAPTLAEDPERYMELLNRMSQVDMTTLGLFANPAALAKTAFGQVSHFLIGGSYPNFAETPANKFKNLVADEKAKMMQDMGIENIYPFPIPPEYAEDLMRGLSPVAESPMSYLTTPLLEDMPIIIDYITEINTGFAGLGPTGLQAVGEISGGFSTFKTDAVAEISIVNQRLAELAQTIPVSIDWLNLPISPATGWSPESMAMSQAGGWSPLSLTVEIDGEAVARTNAAANRRSNNAGPGF